MPSEKSAVKVFEKALSGNLLRHISLAGPTTRAGQIFMEAFNALDTATVNAFFSTATSEQRVEFLGAVPPDRLKDVVAGLPAGIFAPPEPLGPVPAPEGGPPATILQTTYTNVPYSTDSPDWSSDICGGSSIGLLPPPAWEWMSVYDSNIEREGSLSNPVTGLTGWITQDFAPSGTDVPWVHPFGFDWEGYVVPDPQYQNLLAPTNAAQSWNPNLTTHSDFAEANYHAHDVLKLDTPRGVMGVEIEQELVPMNFQDSMRDGTRIAVFGRWIVDGGHNDFHSEIHPPLLMATANVVPGPPGASDVTAVQIISRPYLVSQRFSTVLGDMNWVDKLAYEVALQQSLLSSLLTEFRVALHPTILTPPCDPTTYIELLVRPPLRRPDPLDRLTVSFHFTHRQGVAVRVFDAGLDTVGIGIVLGRLNPSTIPTSHDWNVSIADLRRLNPDKAKLYEAALGIDIFADPLAGVVLARGILTDRYDAPAAVSALDGENVVSAVALDELDPTVGVSEDDVQPFPIYGTLNVGWQRPAPAITTAG